MSGRSKRNDDLRAGVPGERACLEWKSARPVLWPRVRARRYDIGVFLLRAGFLTSDIVELFVRAYEREEVCSHAWWLFEASSRGSLSLHSAPDCRK